MPELPEVENIVLGLRRLSGKTVNAIQVYSREILRVPPDFFSNVLCGEKLLSVSRKGKYLLLGFPSSWKVVIHLGMTGQIFLGEMPLTSFDSRLGPSAHALGQQDGHETGGFTASSPGQARGPQPQQASGLLPSPQRFPAEGIRSPRKGYLPGVQAPGEWPSAARSIDRHTHLMMEFDGVKMIHRDPRRFGSIDLRQLEGASEDRYFGNLGLDARQISRDRLVSLLKTRRTRIKPLLLDQRVIAGLGNIYVDETLFRAGIHPGRKTCRLSAGRLSNLHEAMTRVLDEAIRKGGSSVSDYIRPDGSRGLFQTCHQVYGRSGRPCLRCGSTIKKIRLGGRGTSFCPRCQR